ncbi:MAG TPA: hypothetical protein VFZ40_12920 [Pyrinomonadaceae bacterium]
MSNSNKQQSPFSEATIRRFLLAQLSRGEQSAFERALLMNPQLEQRARFAEIALIDDYVLRRLKANVRELFQKEFLVTTARRRQLEVSKALRQTFAVDKVAQRARSSSAQSLFVWPTFAWRIAFAIVVLMVLFASALVIRQEPQIVRQIIPKRLRPAAVVTPTPAAAHHPVNSAGSADHRDETPQLPAHEASPQTLVLPASSSPGNAPVVSLANNASNAVRLELVLERNESGTFSAVVTTSSGEVVHNVPEIRVEDADRIDFDVQVERLKAGDFRVTLTRIHGEPSWAGTYYFRVP